MDDIERQKILQDLKDYLRIYVREDLFHRNGIHVKLTLGSCTLVHITFSHEHFSGLINQAQEIDQTTERES